MIQSLYMLFILLGLHAVGASTYTFGKAALDYAQPIFFIAIRMLIAGSIFMSYQLARFGRPAIRRQDRHLFVQLALFQIFGAYFLSFVVLPYMPSTVWALIFTLVPFFTAFFSYCILKEKITPQKCIGFAIGFCGVLITFVYNGVTQHPFGGIGFMSVPEMVMLLSVVSYAYGWVVARQLVYLRYHPAVINGISMTSGGLLMLLASFCVDNWQQPLVTSWTALAPILGFIVFASVVSFWLNTFLLRYYTATFLMFLLFTDPIFAGFYGWLFLDEAVTGYFVFSVLGVSAGLYIFYREELRQGYMAE